MSLNEIEEMTSAIRMFLNSPEMDWFWEDNYVNKIVETIDSLANA